MAKKENVRKWIAALRSGKFDQIEGRLGTRFGHCCLGVACEVAIQNGVRIKRSERNGEFAYAGHHDSMPARVRQWLGILDDDGNPPLGGETCAQLNDAGVPFSEIADMIEVEYLKSEASE